MYQKLSTKRRSSDKRLQTRIGEKKTEERGIVRRARYLTFPLGKGKLYKNWNEADMPLCTVFRFFFPNGLEQLQSAKWVDITAFKFVRNGCT